MEVAGISVTRVEVVGDRDKRAGVGETGVDIGFHGGHGFYMKEVWGREKNDDGRGTDAW